MTTLPETPPPPAAPAYPASLSIDYPDRPLDRLTSFFRIFTVIPIWIVLALLASTSFNWDWGQRANDGWNSTVATAGITFFPLVLMLLFRKKYPRWLFDWNLALMRFSYRVGAYLLLLRDEYPSTDEEQAVHLELVYPDAVKLSRGLPLVKWFLAIPHYIVLIFLLIAVIVCAIIAWFAILFTSRYPRGLFDFIVGVNRWALRVWAYALILITDKYPPFSLKA